MAEISDVAYDRLVRRLRQIAPDSEFLAIVASAAQVEAPDAARPGESVE